MPILRALVALAWGLVLACAPAEQAPRDVVLLVVDTLRRDHVSAYAAGVETPNLQRLADQGQAFPNAEASFHQTTMSMGALFTGRTPSIESSELREPLEWTGRSWCGLARFAAGPEDRCVPLGLRTLAETLYEAGYFTAGVVSNRLLFSPAGFEQGFYSWSEVGARNPKLPIEMLANRRSAQRVNETVERVLESRPVAPLFLYVHYMDVHDYVINGESYGEAVARMDRALGRLLEIVEAAGVGENAVLFVTSDHGQGLEERPGEKAPHQHFGNPSYQALLEVPLIVSPALFDESERLVRSADLAALILRAAGVPDSRESARQLLLPGETFVGERRFLTYRRGRFKSSFHRRLLGQWMLFDLESDPGERRNLISTEQELARDHLARVQEIAQQLEVARTEAGDLTEEDRVRLRALGYFEDEAFAMENEALAIEEEAREPSSAAHADDVHGRTRP